VVSWMDNCKKISRMMSDAMDRDLTPWERLRIRVHLLMCTGCAQFARQLQILRAVSRAFVDHTFS